MQLYGLWFNKLSLFLVSFLSAVLLFLSDRSHISFRFAYTLPYERTRTLCCFSRWNWIQCFVLWRHAFYWFVLWFRCLPNREVKFLTLNHRCFCLRLQPEFSSWIYLFVGGCGKFFEGDAAEMNAALNVHIASLPGNTEVWCGHEYTVSNLTFARHVEPNNAAIQEKYEWSKVRRAQGTCTIDRWFIFDCFVETFTESEPSTHISPSLPPTPASFVFPPQW